MGYFLYLLYLKLYYLLAFLGSSTCYIFSIFCTRRFLFSRPLSITLLKYSIIISRSLFTRSSFCGFRNFLLFFDIFSFISLTLAWAFISLQIYEFWIMGISLVDSVYGSIFYFLTGLHFCHLIVGMMMVGMVFGHKLIKKVDMS